MKNRVLITSLSLSAVGLVSILGYEGYSDHAYIPVKGDVPTIGFGTTEGVKMGDTITPVKAVERAYRDADKVHKVIFKCVKVPLSQGEYDAFISFAYNVGSWNFCRSTLVKKLNKGDYEGACLEMKRWIYKDGVVLNGLVTRREEEYQRCMTR